MWRQHNPVTTETRTIRAVLVSHDNENIGLSRLAHRRYLLAFIDRPGE